MTEEKRLLTRGEAAAYCGLKPSAFSDWVRKGTMPKPINGSRRWDKKAIDAKLDEIAGIQTARAPAINDDGESELQKWQREHEVIQADRPKLRLNDRQEQALRYLHPRHPEPQETRFIRGVADRTLEELVEKGAVAEVRQPKDAPRKFKLTPLGLDEHARYEREDQRQIDRYRQR
ncbi:helix-turn-helix transcriptional regulator [Phyllobacterium meliloti]|uniref:helix-turn-helix transcriptional regulator n=1 Tax=Phyllobacterium meliloti TaxID=555317 RepID=UPI001D14E9CB|nr:hypothetical protein [Phyllobacterium sp. T1293]UGX87153.1 hypothetical protein LLE53_004710 [Phyllobacterium sp. T1293]